MQYNFPLEIGGHTYTVYIEPKYSVDSEARQGSEYSLKNEICIGTLLIDGQMKAPSRIEQTFWHEIIHAIDNIYGCELNESNLDRLSEGLLQVFKQFGWKAIKEED